MKELTLINPRQHWTDEITVQSKIELRNPQHIIHGSKKLDVKKRRKNKSKERKEKTSVKGRLMSIEMSERL